MRVFVLCPTDRGLERVEIDVHCAEPGQQFLLADVIVEARDFVGVEEKRTARPGFTSRLLRRLFELLG